ncbi:MAG: hypothetical protein U0401_00800 [Anaerolineae bacterium]
MAKAKKYTLWLADEDCGWRDMLDNKLKRQSGLVLQGCVGSTQETLAILAENPPDLLGVEVRLSDGWGLALCYHCQQMQLPTVTLVLTGYDEDIYLPIVPQPAHGQQSRSSYFGKVGTGQPARSGPLGGAV